MDMQERIDYLNDAAMDIYSAIDKISVAVQGLSMEASAEAYIISHLRNWADGTNPYDETIPKLIEALQIEEPVRNEEEIYHDNV